MTRWAVGGRRSQPFVSFSALRWAVMTGRSASAVCNRVATSVRTPVRPRWSCGVGLGGLGRLTSVQRWNQMRARLSARRESGAAMTQGDLTATACRKAKTSSQSSAMVANVSAAAVSAEACFALPGFTFASSSSIVTTLLLSLTSSASLVESASNAHSVMERAKILRSLPASDSPWRIAASVRIGGRRKALRGVQSICFLDRPRYPEVHEGGLPRSVDRSCCRPRQRRYRSSRKSRKASLDHPQGQNPQRTPQGT